jgi:hypothetical protein
VSSAVPEVPVTRTLPYVLRDQLDALKGVSVLVGKVVSTPDRAHVRVDINGTQVTLPKLASYAAPVVGEPVYILSDPLFTVVLGSVSATLPPSGINADLLDGIDSTGFLQMMTAGTRFQISGGRFTGSTNASGQTTHAHGLGRIPTIVTALPDRLSSPATTEIMGASADATNVVLQWVFSGGAIPGVGFNVAAWLMVIG